MSGNSSSVEKGKRVALPAHYKCPLCLFGATPYLTEGKQSGAYHLRKHTDGKLIEYDCPVNPDLASKVTVEFAKSFIPLCYGKPPLVPGMSASRPDTTASEMKQHMKYCKCGVQLVMEDSVKAGVCYSCREKEKAKKGETEPKVTVPMPGGENKAKQEKQEKKCLLCELNVPKQNGLEVIGPQHTQLDQKTIDIVKNQWYHIRKTAVGEKMYPCPFTNSLEAKLPFVEELKTDISVTCPLCIADVPLIEGESGDTLYHLEPKTNKRVPCRDCMQWSEDVDWCEFCKQDLDKCDCDICTECALPVQGCDCKGGPTSGYLSDDFAAANRAANKQVLSSNYSEGEWWRSNTSGAKTTYVSCTHKPTKLLQGTGKGSEYEIWAGKRWDVTDHLREFDVILNCSGSSVSARHNIPLPGFEKWENFSTLKEIQLDWPDRDIVDLPFEFWRELLDYFEKNESKVLVFCVGGHGRTGTAIACIMVASGWKANEAISWLRRNYCKEAIEEQVQEWYIRTMETAYNKAERKKAKEKKKSGQAHNGKQGEEGKGASK